MENYNLHYVDNDDKLNTLVKAVQQNGQFGFDVEASSLDPITGTLLLIQLFTGREVFVINCGKVKKPVITYIFELINSSQKLLVGHNIKFDMRYIHINYGVMPLYVYDTQEAEVLQKAGLIGPYHKLSKLLKKYLGVTVDKDVRETFIDKTDFEFTPEQIEYAAEDVCYLLLLKEELDKKIQDSKQVNTMNLESRVLPAVAEMENNGFPINVSSWMEGVRDAQKTIEERRLVFFNYVAENFGQVSVNPENAVKAFEDFSIPIPNTKIGRKTLEEIVVYDEIVAKVMDTINFNSTKQMKRLLNAFGVHEDTTNKRVIKKYPDNEFIKRLLSYREFLKDDTTYGESFIDKVNPETGRIHADFNPTRAATGRFGCTKPNLQNIKKDSSYRERFECEEGWLLATADYSQIELREAAKLSNETVMIDAFNRGDDLHTLTAAAIFDKDPKDVTEKERNTGKTLNFAVIYGTSVAGLFYNFDIPEEQGKVYLDRFFDKYKNLAYFIRQSGKLILEKGYSSTANGRRRFFTVPITFTKRDIRKMFAIKREGVNHIVQGTCADMLKMAICNIYYDNPYGKDLKLVNTVHDEVVVEFRDYLKEEARTFINQSMVKAGDYFLRNIVETKVDIKISRRWSKKDNA